MLDFFTTDVFSLIIVSLGVGVAVGLTGMGGGALMTPALIAFGIPPVTAVANDLVASAANKSVGALVHWRQGSPHLRIAGWLMLGSIPTAFAGAFIVQSFGEPEEANEILLTIIGVALMLAAVTYLARMLVRLANPVGAEDDVQVKPLRTVGIGMLGGTLVGITSVGSGSVIMVTLLLLYPALSPRKLVGTDLLQAVPLVVAAALSHVIVTGVDWEVLVPLLIGGPVGTYLGSRLSTVVKPAVVQNGIVIVLSLTSLALLGLPPVWVGVVGAAMLILGPLIWAGIVHRVAGRGTAHKHPDSGRPPP
ncbi:sulfite exporter TauE/SafE family protein [Ornithinimicrobium faecis]|uniref:Probable membrane transporter protein n=1 Tax=Ornithinimicrobium faecis TaxID=2934158 RepID=A0ABY4YT09_9MICO|nr:sulfite exporter TauE/SafE family protein [Ornithinimicrobium sp. HY1793]USQ79874.1 sulfite exporter TauE/SafE family protein [Ornithinimicrobium sp. HY1793]